MIFCTQLILVLFKSGIKIGYWCFVLYNIISITKNILTMLMVFVGISSMKAIDMISQMMKLMNEICWGRSTQGTRQIHLGYNEIESLCLKVVKPLDNVLLEPLPVLTNNPILQLSALRQLLDSQNLLMLLEVANRSVFQIISK